MFSAKYKLNKYIRCIISKNIHTMSRIKKPLPEPIIQARIKGKDVIDFATIDALCGDPNYNEIVWLKMKHITFRRRFYFPIKTQQIYISECIYCCDYLGCLPEQTVYASITDCKMLSIDDLFNPDYEYPVLETVDLSYNRLTRIPAHFPRLVHSVNLSNNDIYELPPANPFVTENITNLDLSQNKLTDLPAWIADFDITTTDVILMPNKFWFNSFSYVSINRIVTPDHVRIFYKHFPNIQRDFTTHADGTMTFRHIDLYDRPVNHQNFNTALRHIHIPDLNHQTLVKPTAKTTAEQAQNVHNSNIQNSFGDSVAIIMACKLPKNPRYLDDIYNYYVLNKGSTKKQKRVTRVTFLENIQNGLTDINPLKLFNSISTSYNNIKDTNFYNTIKYNCELPTIVSKCGVTYGEIFERIWALSGAHEHRTEIRSILREEIESGKTYCFTGQVTRLVNSLCGFVEGIQISYSDNEQINNAVIATMRRCEKNDRLIVKDEVKKVLDELQVPKDKQKDWLDAFDGDVSP